MHFIYIISLGNKDEYDIEFETSICKLISSHLTKYVYYLLCIL